MAGDLKPQVFIQNSAPLNPSNGDFWFDTSAGTQLNFRYNSWVAIDIPTAALDTLSNSVSVLSNAVSVISQAQSVLSVQVVSVISLHNALSTAVSAISVKVDALSTTVSALSLTVSALSTAVSVVSVTLASVISQVSLISATLASVQSQVSLVSATLTSVQSQVSLISANVQTLSAAHSVLSAGLGAMQMRWVSTVQGVSSTAAAGIAISGLSLSLAAAGIYQVEGIIYYQVSAIPTTIGISFTYPALVSAQGTGTVTGYGGVTGGGAGHGQIGSVLQGSFDWDASNSIVYSAILSAASTFHVKIEAMLNVSTAGTFQANMRTSATTQPVNVFPGSFLRAFRIV